MAAPKLKINTPAPGARPKLAVAAAPAARVKLNAGAAPVKRPTLVGAGGQAIKPKTPTPAPAAEPEITPVAAPEPVAAPVPTPEPEPVAAPVATPAPEPVADTVAEEAAAEAAAQAEAAAAAEAAAQAEYERQMEEYNRQMEEYNRQMAEYQAQQEAAAAPEQVVEEAPAPAPTPAAAKPKVAAPKPAGLKAKAAAPKPAGLKSKAAAPKPAAALAQTDEPQGDEEDYTESGMSEDQMSARDAYLQQLQTMAEKKPFHKTPLFYIALGSLVALSIGCSVYVQNVNAERNARKAKIDATNAILKRAHEINKNQIETMDDARRKNFTVECSKEDAQCLLNMVVNPFAKDEQGRNAYGAAPKQTAQLACLLLALASEMEPTIDNLIFSTLDKNAPTMDPDIFRYLIQRMAISNNKGINSKFRKLADSVAAKPKWTKKATILSHIWESMGLRVSEKDIPDIISLLKADELDEQLAKALSQCLQNIIMMEDDLDKKQQLGDTIFETLPEKHRFSMQGALGRSCSPKALAHYKEQAENPDEWRNVEFFFANYYNDDIIPYLLELKAKATEAVEAAGDDKAALRKAKANLDSAEHMLGSVVGQNRDRESAEAQELINLVFDKLNVDCSGYADTEEGSQERADMDACFKQKEMLINTLAGMHDHAWVMEQLDKLYNDSDVEIANKAKLAIERVKKNTAEDALMKSKYKSRDKQ
ncbi:MAG: hypothetical protein IKZ13_03615 [Akkermansia sp.]|nr:hypothetical protein [Akkermansia sp.]